VARRDANGDDVPLEVIDLEPELGSRPDRSASRPRRWSTVVGLGAAAVAVAGAAVLATKSDDGSEPPSRRTEAVGRFYPSLPGADEVRLVLPSGVTIVLSDAQRTLDGLGATFAGGIGSIGFRIAHGPPSDLFASLGPTPIRRAVAVAGAHAREPFAYSGRLAVLSSGGWTLVAFLSDDEQTADAELHLARRWELRPTANGAVVRAPAQIVGDASVVLVDDASAAGRRVELTEDNCAGTAQRTEAQLGESATGYWCENGVYVHISGPEPFVANALATLRVDVQRPGALGTHRAGARVPVPS
jgi:hypothetical protein